MNNTMTPNEAEALGFAKFNGGNHLCIEVPDGYFTISARTSSGKRITFSFVPYRENGEAGCVDVQYHDSGKKVPHDDGFLHLFHSIGFSAGGNTYDTRKIVNDTGKQTSLITVLIDPKHYAEVEA